MTQDTAITLDHIGVCNHALGPMAAAYEALGFRLSPASQQSGRRTPDGPVEPFGTGNRCAFLEHGYIELLAIMDPALFDNQLGGFLARYEGMHILALGMADTEAQLRRLRAHGLEVPGISPLQRRVSPEDDRLARFERLPLPAAPEGRVQLIRHLTPELVWQRRWMDHPNRAVALEEVLLVTADPEEAAGRLSLLAGRPAEPGAGRRQVIRLPGAAGLAGPFAPLRETRITILDPPALPEVLPGVVAPTLPFLAGFVLRTEDGNQAVRALLGDRGRPLPGGGLLVPPALAAGAAIVFAP